MVFNRANNVGIIAIDISENKQGQQDNEINNSVLDDPACSATNLTYEAPPLLSPSECGDLLHRDVAFLVPVKSAIHHCYIHPPPVAKARPAEESIHDATAVEVVAGRERWPKIFP